MSFEGISVLCVIVQTIAQIVSIIWMLYRQRNKNKWKAILPFTFFSGEKVYEVLCLSIMCSYSLLELSLNDSVGCIFFQGAGVVSGVMTWDAKKTPSLLCERLFWFVLFFYPPHLNFHWARDRRLLFSHNSYSALLEIGLPYDASLSHPHTGLFQSNCPSQRVRRQLYA